MANLPLTSVLCASILSVGYEIHRHRLANGGKIFSTGTFFLGLVPLAAASAALADAIGSGSSGSVHDFLVSQDRIDRFLIPILVAQALYGSYVAVLVDILDEVLFGEATGRTNRLAAPALCGGALISGAAIFWLRALPGGLALAAVFLCAAACAKAAAFLPVRT